MCIALNLSLSFAPFSEASCAVFFTPFNERGRVLPSVGECAWMWEGVPQCGRVCPSVGGCVPVWEGVPLYLWYVCAWSVGVLVTCTYDECIWVFIWLQNVSATWQRPMWLKHPEISCYWFIDSATYVRICQTFVSCVKCICSSRSIRQLSQHSNEVLYNNWYIIYDTVKDNLVTCHNIACELCPP